jgi:hypothetical protein
MTAAQVIKVFELFFPDVPMRTKFDNERLEVYYIEDNNSYTVLYRKKLNHLEVFSTNLKETYPTTTIIEGSPEDIIKLSKLLIV